MSTRKGKAKPPASPTGVIVTPAPAAPTEPDVDLSPDPQYAALEAVLGELGGSSNSQFTVYRSKKNEPLRFLFKCPPEAFSLDELRDKYNGGDFRLYVAKDGQLWRNMVVSVEAPVKPMTAADQLPASADIVIAMREGFEKQSQLLRETILALKPAPTPPLDIPQLLTAATGMIAALRQASEPRATPAPAPAPAAASIESMIGLLQKGIELGKDITPGAAGADAGGLLGIVRDLVRSPLAGAVLEAVRAQAGQVQPAQQQQRVFPAPQPVQAAPAPAAAAPTQDATMKAAIDQLVLRAEKGADPALYAAYIFDNIPEGRLRLLLGQPNVLDELTRINPAVQSYRPWFEALYTELLELLEEASGGHTGLTPAGAGANGTVDAARPDAANVPGAAPG